MTDNSDISIRAAARRSRTVALIIASGMFMQGLDGTIIVTALPAMAHAFGVKPSDLSIGITSYMLAMASILPVTGWISDRFGARNVFAVSVVVFTLASLLCARADSLTTFTAARMLQGLGAGLMGSVGRLVVMRNTDNQNMLASVALMVWPALAAPIVGPALGGLIVTHADWPWIFLVNLPIGIVGVALVMTFVPDVRSPERKPFDGAGLALSAGAMICLVSSLEIVSHSRTPWPPLILLAAGAALGVTAYRRFKTRPDPLIELDALKVQTFRTASLSGGWPFRMTVMAVPFVMPLMFQVGFGFSPVRSGLLMMGYFFGNLAMKPFTTLVLRRFGFRQTLVVNSIISAVLVAAFAFFTPAASDAVMLVVIALSGASRSMQFTCLDSLTYCDIPPGQRAGATTVWGLTNQLAAVMGVAFGAIAINLSRSLRGDVDLAAVDFRLTVIGMGVLTLTTLPSFLRLPRNAGADVTGHRAR